MIGVAACSGSSAGLPGGKDLLLQKTRDLPLACQAVLNPLEVWGEPFLSGGVVALLPAVPESRAGISF